MANHLSTFKLELLGLELLKSVGIELSELEPAGSKALSGSTLFLFWLTHGSHSETRVPLPGWLSARMVPPSIFASRHAVSSPRPLPRPDSLVAKKGLNARPRVSLSIPQPVSLTASSTQGTSCGFSSSQLPFSEFFCRYHVQFRVA